MDSPTIAMSVTNQNQEMTDFSYKKYSLENLENWLHDAISCGEASPHEIYSTIRKVVQENHNIYKEKAQQCFGLLELLSGHRPVDFEKPYEKDGMMPWGHSDIEYLIQNNVKENKWTLPIEIDGLTGECYVSLPDDLLDKVNWNQGDTVEWVDRKDGSFELRKVANG